MPTPQADPGIRVQRHVSQPVARHDEPEVQNHHHCENPCGQVGPKHEHEQVKNINQISPPSPLPPFTRVGVQLAQAFGDGVDVGLGGGAEAFGEVGDLVGVEVVSKLAGAGDGGGEGGAGADPFVEGVGTGHVGLFREAAERGAAQNAVFDALDKLRRAVAGEKGGLLARAA